MPTRLPVPTRILVPLIVACALFMENLDSTVLATALPTIARDIGADPIHLKLALTSYLLSLAVFIPASGWIADRFGARLVFRLAIAVFTIGSILCGLSSTLGGMIASRVIQGIGGSMMVPVGRLVILRTVPKSELVGSLAWLTVPALIGPVLGPPVGGFITTYFHWRWIFWINIPIGVLGIVLATLFIPDVRGETRTKFDASGFLMSAIGLAAFVTGSTSLGLDVIPMPVGIGMVALGAVMILLYIRHSRIVAAPILDLSLLRVATFRASLIGGSLFRIGVGATPFLLPLLLQIGFGLDAFRSGMTTFVAAIGAIAMKVSAQPILKRLGFRTVLAWNALIGAVFIGLPAAFSATSPQAFLLLVLLIGGFFRSLQFTAINAIGYADIEQPQMSRATSLTSVVQQVSLSVGVSVGALVLEASLKARGAAHIEAVDFTPAFLVVAAISALSFIVFRRLPADAGHEVSGHRKPGAQPDPVTVMRERA